MHDVFDGSDDGDDVLHEQWDTSSRRCAVCPNPRGRVPGAERHAGLAVAKLKLKLKLPAQGKGKYKQKWL